MDQRRIISLVNLEVKPAETRTKYKPLGSGRGGSWTLFQPGWKAALKLVCSTTTLAWLNTLAWITEAVPFKSK